MKNWKYLLLVAAIFTLVLCACGGETAEESADQTEETVQSTQTEEIAKEEPVVEEETVIIEETEEAEIVQEETELAETFEAQVLVDNEYCKVTVKGFEEDPLWGYTMKVALENKSEDITMMFSMNDVSVNGYMCDPFWASSVAAGKKANDEVSWLASDFEENEIKEVTEIEFELRVYNDDDWAADDFVNEVFTIYP